MASTPEGRVKIAITKMLKHYGAYYYMPVPGGYGTTTVDYLGCSGGSFFAIEAKAPGKHPTDRQTLILYEINKAGGETFVIDNVRCKRMDELEAFLILTTTRK
jgi:hypothetical protein